MVKKPSSVLSRSAAAGNGHPHKTITITGRIIFIPNRFCIFSFSLPVFAQFFRTLGSLPRSSLNSFSGFPNHFRQQHGNDAGQNQSVKDSRPANPGRRVYPPNRCFYRMGDIGNQYAKSGPNKRQPPGPAEKVGGDSGDNAPDILWFDYSGIGVEEIKFGNPVYSQGGNQHPRDPSGHFFFTPGAGKNINCQ